MKDLSALSVRLPSRLKEWLEERAEENGRSMNSEIVQILKTIHAEQHQQRAAA